MFRANHSSKRSPIHFSSSHARAFTLIEILVVVAIIALLISILLPSLAAARESTRRTVCGTQLGEMSKALVMYNNEQKEYLPGPIHQALELETVDKVANWDHETWHLPSFLRKYFSDRSKRSKLTDGVVRCPTADKITSTKSIWSNTDSARPFTYALNNWRRIGTTPYRYGTNPEQYFGWPDDFYRNGTPDVNGRFPVEANPPAYAVPKKISKIKQHGREWAIGDAFRYPEGQELQLIKYPARKAGDWQVGTYQNATWLKTAGIPLPRAPYHDKGVNVAMFDGHVEYQRPWRGSVNAE